ncbi:MAG: hypothetical protein LQ340_004427 [Diploschistes diacapsis]|nr:MAG: hypothetical protein LQ340_004427 [Diploschistes diacapsis]
MKREKRRFKYGEKLDKADDEWALRAEKIEAGRQDSMLSILEKRGYVHSIAGDRDELDRLMISKRIGAYAGVDPTAPSMHVGHLLPLMVLLWLYVHGFNAITLLGGSTAQIGDPSGRKAPREKTARTTRIQNMASMHLQMKKFWENMEKHATNKYGYEKVWSWERGLINNNAWWGKTTFLDVMRYLGTSTRMGTMLSRDTAKTRLQQSEGMSYAEFSYPLMQAWDWWMLFKQRDIQLQIGGADQFGNIVAGIEGVDSVADQLVDKEIEPTKFGPLAKKFGLTVPLLTTASGEKFGKSAGNAIWLDPEMTPIFEQYQFWLRFSDADVGRYLRLFTLIPLSEIDDLLTQHTARPQARKAQHRLAYEVITLLHGPVEADKVLQSHNMLFSRKPASPNNPPAKPVYVEDPAYINRITNRNIAPLDSTSAIQHHVTLPRSLVIHSSAARVLMAVGLVASGSEGQRLMAAKGAYVGRRSGKNPTMQDGLDYRFILETRVGELAQFIIDDSMLILRAGKWNVKIVRVVGDEEFERMGLDVPGWKEFKEKGLQNVGEAGEVGSEGSPLRC